MMMILVSHRGRPVLLHDDLGESHNSLVFLA